MPAPPRFSSAPPHRASVRELAAYLKLRILADDYPPGSLLPSIRRLAMKFDLTYSTVRKALLALEEEACIHRRGSRFIVRDWRPPERPDGIPVAVIGERMVNALPSMYREALLGMLDAALEWNFRFHFFVLRTRETTRERLVECCRGMVGAVLLQGYDVPVPDLTLPVPAVGIMMFNAEGRFSTVNIDPEDAARRAVDYFLRREVRKIRIYTTAREVFRWRTRLFTRLFEAAGGEIVSEELAEQGRRLPPAEPDVGLFFASDSIAHNYAVDFRQATGERLADRFAVLGIDGKRLIREDFEEFPSIAFNWPRLGRIALEELHRLLRRPDEPCRNITVCGVLVN